jgi:predicted metal-dependent hydrolase
MDILGVLPSPRAAAWYKSAMQFHLPFGPARLRAPDEHWLRVGAERVRLWLAPHRRARRYVLRLRPDGAARVTIPRGGSAAEALRFAEKHIPWLERQLRLRTTQPARSAAWLTGTEILFRGERVRLETVANGEDALARLGAETVRVADPATDLRPEIQRHLWRLAARELPARVLALAALHGFGVTRVTIRNQRSRWGSCSRRGTVSLNWRLIQAPPAVCDYIILHELAHLREMNHSSRFWRTVAELCPEFAQAEQWLKQHRELLR